MGFLGIYNGHGDGALLLAVILIVIIIIKLTGKKKSEPIQQNEGSSAIKRVLENNPLDLNDEDATVACLVAAIDYRNTVKKNVKVVSVREVK